MKKYRFGLKNNPPVFWGSAILILTFVILGINYTNQFTTVVNFLQSNLVLRFGWFFSLSIGVFLCFVIWLLFSKYGSIRLGQDDSRPSYDFLSWIAMLFSAGMGIGLVFYGVAEPVIHHITPPVGSGETIQSAKDAMKITFFHWGLHAWSIYIVIGLALAYFSHRKGLPLTISSALYPILGKKIYGTYGHIIDILAVVGTLFGVATSLGLGVMQINAGLGYLFSFQQSTQVQLILIAVITLAATISVASGLDKGILRLSQLNIFLGLLLLVFVFLIGPTVNIANSFVQNIGYYIQNIPEMTLWTSAYNEDSKTWLEGWTIFYWAWWIAWSPFVGMFIARISKGRTIREFILGVLFVPTILTFIWLTVFGNTAIELVSAGNTQISKVVSENIPLALYVFLQNFPWSIFSSFLGTIVVIGFFITSSDSASYVIDIITSGGNQNPPVGQKIFWASLEGIVAAILLAGGGLKALQTAAITTALPFVFVLLLICYSLLKAFKNDPYILTQNQDEIGVLDEECRESY